MRFTWYTYAAAIARAQAEFNHAFGDFEFEDIRNPDSDIIRTHTYLILLQTRIERERPERPAEFLCDLARWVFYRRYKKEFG